MRHRVPSDEIYQRKLWTADFYGTRKGGVGGITSNRRATPHEYGANHGDGQMEEKRRGAILE
jgi:hypothetical protein